MDWSIRKAEHTDIATLVQFQTSMALETENMVLDSKTVNAGVQQLMDDPAKGQYYVAHNQQTIVGCLMITKEWSDWRCAMVWWIQSVYVDKLYRNQGVYKQMYQSLKEMVMNDPHVSGIRLYVDKSNHAAKEVYEKLGMTGDHYELFEWMK